MLSAAQAYSAAQATALRGSTALATAMATGGRGIVVQVPVNQTPPYVVLGDVQVLLENHDCADEAELTATVHLWARPATPDKAAQAHAMGAAITAALNAQLTLTDWTVDEWELVSERYLTDPDQSTHGILEFRYLLTEQV